MRFYTNFLKKKKRSEQLINETEIVKGEYIYWIIFCYLFVLSSAYLFGFVGLLMGIGLFGLIGMLLIHLKVLIFFKK